MIKFDQVHKRYPGNLGALQNITFEINAGELVFVTGPSGAGKSTLLKLITAIEPATHGTIIFENQNLGQVKNASIPYIRRKFGLVFQDHKLLYDRNCFENITLALEINEVEVNDIRGRVRAALDKVGLLNREKSMPISLSGGEQQRLAIARAIACRPSILLADEPTGNLDKKYADEIMSLFYSFQELGVTVIIATHEMPIVSKKHKQLYLQDGNLIKITEQ
ncbi:ATP-binding cassette domain-containing protein [Candidatus Methylopumilus universalis]|jgi:cell division transport system ATP-binding protein|uniref:Cell division ATP-binding protein FtsE n=1 Tax=Candidatus Methylopumilus universalis TaxID=2588536 RepID=A0AAX1F081_9PROT|nr:ATP-binding cassette domain-containing protein [Candidatus Methylopumilus universalis]MBP6152144.1 ATP-binding cassette domain-containing protein [Candidatus Methylopumilus sp.]MCF8182692.1 ATP-binding cassette domain-containing protein [Limnohabitans sp.]MBP7855706.1 ATP-binding cassette domain-containing protein [Candidatus Methylopumilus sp.]MBW0155897.1 ATP-binding cassette domain-containing protein [Candidatus Methylopumilus sp.]MCF8161696.1 ATP-binding cassette domain-containing prote